MTKPLAAPKGVYDVVGADSARWDALEARFYETAARYGYARVRIPVLEHTDLFVRSVGEATDIVRKEMYTFPDRAGRSLTLRPEGTAGMVRCFVEHSLDQQGLPWKASYGGAMFRAENVQRGRYRQFHQLGVEAIGVDDPALDVEVVTLGWDFLTGLGLADVTLLVNSIGRPEERTSYVGILGKYVEQTVPDLGPDDRERLKLNPLRILDSKDPRVQEALAGGPKLRESLGPDSLSHFEDVQSGLEALGVPYVVDDTLVRGLDYYTSTTFEYTSGALDAAQNALGGGGHYDGLVEMVGGPSLPGIGFALGVERILLACEAEDVLEPGGGVVDVIVLVAGDTGTVARLVVKDLRDAGVKTDTAYGGRSLKAQFKQADRIGARVALVIGERDLDRGVITLRDLGSGEQVEIPVEETVQRVREVMDR